MWKYISYVDTVINYVHLFDETINEIRTMYYQLHLSKWSSLSLGGWNDYML